MYPRAFTRITVDDGGMSETPPERLWRLSQRQADDLGVTLKDIATSAGVSEQALWKWRRGGSMRPRTDRAIAAAFGWTETARQELLDGKDPQPLPPHAQHAQHAHTGLPPAQMFDDRREQAIWGLEALTEDERLWLIKAIRDLDTLKGHAREDLG